MAQLGEGLDVSLVDGTLVLNLEDGQRVGKWIGGRCFRQNHDQTRSFCVEEDYKQFNIIRVKGMGKKEEQEMKLWGPGMTFRGD